MWWTDRIRTFFFPLSYHIPQKTDMLNFADTFVSKRFFFFLKGRVFCNFLNDYSGSVLLLALGIWAASLLAGGILDSNKSPLDTEF